MVTRADWDGFNHARHGSSPDLVVALCLQQHLGCSKLASVDTVELVSGNAIPLPLRDWPASWEEFDRQLVLMNFSIEAGILLRGRV